MVFELLFCFHFPSSGLSVVLPYRTSIHKYQPTTKSLKPYTSTGFGEQPHPVNRAGLLNPYHTAEKENTV
jgi:hypothetical protein